MFKSKVSHITLLSLMVLLSACANTKQFHYKTGQLVQSTTCEGGSWSQCYLLAGEICQAKGYEVIERTNFRTSGFFSSTDNKELIFSCNKDSTTLK